MFHARPQFVGPHPNVLKLIRQEMREEHLGRRDMKMTSVAMKLGVEPPNLHGWNEGLFYPLDNLPERVAGLALAPSAAVRKRPTTGNAKCLVLLVDFTDNPGNRPPQEFQDLLFSRGTLPSGSMHDFYAENSFGQFDLDGDVVGWLRLPQPYSFYVDHQSGWGAYPNNAQKMVEDALALAARQVNFRKYDVDGDGYMDGLFVIHAGGGAEAEPNTAARAAKIWSHQWNLPQPYVSSGVTVYAYCTEPEDGQAGVFCHEFGHMLGLPDLYDTTYRSEGVGVWCVMGGGSWNNGGRTPGHFCAWAKSQLGWISPTNVKSPAALSLAEIEKNSGGAYRLWSKGKPGSEYFLIENRQLIGFDARLPGGGLLVWHIDESQTNNDHQGAYRVGLVQADGKHHLELGLNRGDKGDPFPGSTRNVKFDSTTSPSADDNLGNPTSVSIAAILQNAAAINCKVSV